MYVSLGRQFSSPYWMNEKLKRKSHPCASHSVISVLHRVRQGNSTHMRALPPMTLAMMG